MFEYLKPSYWVEQAVLKGAGCAYNVADQLGIVATVQSTASAWLFKESAENYKAQPDDFAAELGHTVLQSTVATAVFSTVVGSVAAGGVAMASTSVLAGAAVTSAGLFVIEKSFGKWASDYTSAGLQYGSAGIALEAATKTADYGMSWITEWEQNHITNAKNMLLSYDALYASVSGKGAFAAVYMQSASSYINNEVYNVVKPYLAMGIDLYAAYAAAGSLAAFFSSVWNKGASKVVDDFKTEQEVLANKAEAQALIEGLAELAEGNAADNMQRLENKAEAKEFLGAIGNYSNEVAADIQELAAPREARLAETEFFQSIGKEAESIAADVTAAAIAKEEKQFFTGMEQISNEIAGELEFQKEFKAISSNVGQVADENAVIARQKSANKALAIRKYMKSSNEEAINSYVDNIFSQQKGAAGKLDFANNQIMYGTLGNDVGVGSSPTEVKVDALGFPVNAPVDSAPVIGGFIMNYDSAELPNYSGLAASQEIIGCEFNDLGANMFGMLPEGMNMNEGLGQLCAVLS